MLARINRLPKEAIGRLLVGGSILANKTVVVYSAFTKQNIRFVIVVGKKVAKLSTIRNRLKKVSRHCLCNLLNKIKAGDYAIVLKPIASQIETKALIESLQSIMANYKIAQK